MPVNKDKLSFFDFKLALGSLLIVILTSILSLIGWFSKFYLLGGIIRFIPMSPSTAIGFLLISSVILIEFRFSSNKNASFYCKAVCSLLFVLSVLKVFNLFPTLGQNIEGKLILRLYHGTVILIGGVSPVTAFNLIVISFFLLFQDFHNAIFKRIYGIALTGIAFINFIVIISYLFGTPLFYNLFINNSVVVPISLPTAINFILVTVAVSALNGPNEFPLQPFTGSSTRARLFRTFIPLVIGLVILNGIIYYVFPIYFQTNPAILSTITAAISIIIATVFIFKVAEVITKAIEKTEQEKRLAEKAFKENQALFISAFNFAPLAVALINKNGEFLKVNLRFTEVFGYTEKELTSMNVTEIIREEDKEEILHNISDILSQKSDHFFQEKKYKHKSGKVINAFMGVSGVKDESGEISYFIVQLNDITEKKSAEAALAASEKIFKSTFENAPIGMAVVGLKGEFLKVNSTWSDIIGYTEAELLKLSFREITHPEDQLKSLDYLEKCLSGEITSFSTEKRYISKTGKELRVLLSASLVFDALHQPLYFISHFKDITASKRAEEALIESEQRFRILTEANFEGVVIHDQGTIIDSNSSFAKMFGYEREELIGKSVLDLSAPESHEKIKENILNNYQKAYESICLRKDGTTFSSELIGKSIPYKGRMVRVTAVRDITEQKAAEVILKESEQRYRLMFENNPAPMWVYDVESLRFLDVNKALVRYYGYSKEELLEMSIQDLYSDDDAELAVLINKMSKSTEGLNLTGEWKLKQKDGSLIYSDIVTHSFSYNNKKAKLVIANDITEQKKAEQRILQSEKRFRALVERSSDVYVILSSKGAIKYTAPTTLKILGYTSEEFVGTNLFNLIHTEDVSTSFTEFSDILKTPGVNFKNVFRVQHKNGKYLWFESISINYLEDPNIDGIISNLRDITDKKQEQEEELFSNDLVQTIIHSETIQSGLKEVLQKIGTYTGWKLAQAWLPDNSGSVKKAASWNTDNAVYQKLNEDAHQLLTEGWALFERLLQDNKPLVYPDLKKFRDSQRALAISETGLSASFLIPVYYENNLEAVFSFLNDRFSVEDERLSQLIFRIAGLLSIEIRNQQIREHLKFQATVLQNIGDSIIATDLNGNIIYWNEGSAEIYGYSEEEVLGKPLTLLYPEKHQNSLGNNVKYILEQEDYSGVRKLITKNGEARYMEVKTSKFIDNTGKIAGLIGISKDITERRKAEKALELSEQKFHKVFKASPIAISISRLEDQVYIDVNDAFAELAGIPYESIIGKTNAEVFLKSPYQGENQTKAHREKLLSEGSVFIPEQKIMRDGEECYIQFFLELIEVDGKPCVLALINDITMQKRAGEELSASEERYKAVTNLFSDYTYVYTIDKEGREKREDVKHSIAEAIGLENVTLTLDNYLEYIHPDDHEIAKERARRLLNGESAVVEYRMINNKGEVHWLRDYSLPIFDKEKKKLKRIYGVGQNITEQKKAEKELEENKEKFRILFEKAPVAIQISRDGIIQSVNTKFAELLGYRNPKELYGISVSDLIARENRKFIVDKLISDSSIKMPLSYEVSVLKKDGSEITLHLSMARLKLPDGDATIAYFQDLSESIEVRKLLEESRNSLTNLITNLPGIVYRCRNDVNWTMEFISEGLTELTGYTPSDILIDKKITYSDIIHPDDREEIWKEVQKALKKQRPFVLNYRIITATGEVKNVWEQGSAITLADGRTVLEGFVTEDFSNVKKSDGQEVDEQSQSKS